MKRYRQKFLLTVSLFAVFGSTVARAQQPQPAPPASPEPRTERAGTRPAADVLARIGQGAGMVVLADSVVGRERVPLPATATTPENAEQQIADVVKALPAGTTWAKLYLPPPANGRWNGDDLASYALAQAKLFGSVGAAPAGTVEILGKRLPASEAQDLIARLNLKPVYLVANPSQTTAASSRGSVSLEQWMAMSPEQREQSAQQQASQLLNMDPNARNQALMQQGMMFRAMFQQLSPEQRQQMMQGMQQFLRGGGPGGGGPGGGPGGGR